MSLFSVRCPDIEQWAGKIASRSAQGDLPHLIRLLILATHPDAEGVYFSAGDSVVFTGFDGITIASSKTQYIPYGLTIWEMGANSDYKTKAQKDYDKRTKAGVDPNGQPISQCSFIFVTPRRWTRSEGTKSQQVTKASWVRERKKEAKWRDVRLYDAEDIEQWLLKAPAVTEWFRFMCGKPEGIFPLDQWLDEWCLSKFPTADPQTFLEELGQEQVEKLAKLMRVWLTSSDENIEIAHFSIISGLIRNTGKPESHVLSFTTRHAYKSEEVQRREILAYLAAVLLYSRLFNKKDVYQCLARMVVVDNETSWRNIALTRPSLILIPLFGNTGSVHRAYHKETHYVLLPLSQSDYSSWKNPDTIFLELPESVSPTRTDQIR